MPKYSKIIKPSFHLFLINIKFDRFKKSKDDFIKYCIKNKILAQQHYIPIYKFKVYSDDLNNYPGSENFFKNTVSVPIFVNLNIKQQNKVIRTIKNFINLRSSN